MSHTKDRLAQVRSALHQVASGSIREGARALLNLLGYDSPKTLDTSGDPLELASAPERVWIDGVEQPMETRQTKLRDRYATPAEGDLPKAYRL